MTRRRVAGGMDRVMHDDPHTQPNAERNEMERNTDLFFAVADAIEQHPEQYDQSSYYDVPECGATACIAGWAVAIHHGRELPTTLAACARAGAIGDRAGAALGLAEWEMWGRFDEPTDAWKVGLFHDDWRPHDGLSVPDALRKIGEGAAIEDVSA